MRGETSVLMKALKSREQGGVVRQANICLTNPVHFVDYSHHYHLAIRRDVTVGGCFSRLAQILRQHVTKQRALLDGVVEGDVGVRARVEPVFGHCALSALAVILLARYI